MPQYVVANQMLSKLYSCNLMSFSPRSLVAADSPGFLFLGAPLNCSIALAHVSLRRFTACAKRQAFWESKPFLIIMFFRTNRMMKTLSKNVPGYAKGIVYSQSTR